jgi:hypothetical protein
MRKILISIFIVIVIGIFAFFADFPNRLSGEDRPLPLSYATTTLLIGEDTLILEIADTDQKRSLGLSGREGLASGTGMLFIFDEAGFHGFWMKDMRFVIDIAWLNDDFCIVTLARSLSPDTYPTAFIPDAPVRYAIEVPSGFLGLHNMSKGSCFDR